MHIKHFNNNDKGDISLIYLYYALHNINREYRGADKSLARPDQKIKRLKGRHFSLDAEVIAAAETWLDGQNSELL